MFLLNNSQKSINLNLRKDILPRIKEIIHTTIFSCKRHLNKNNRKYCFQLFGYDLILDRNLKTWLIEINTNPGIDETTPHLSMLVARMVNDIFKLTLDVIFPRPYQWTTAGYKNDQDVKTEEVKMISKLDYFEYINQQGQGKYPVAGYPDNQNMWEFMG